MKLLTLALFAGGAALLAASLGAQQSGPWMTVWTGSAQGPYPSGNPSAQPDLRGVFPAPDRAARDQTFRMIVRPEIWAPSARVRLSNAFGTRPVTFDDVFAGLQLSGAAVVPGTNRPVTFGGKTAIAIAPGADAWSDPVTLPFVTDANASLLSGRKLAVSFHVAGESGPMTWHAKALTTSFVTAPGAGSKGGDETEAAFPYSTASWFFIDAVDMVAAADARVIVALGDSITDGTASTMNGDDRWTDVLSRRLHRLWGNRVAVVNAGIGGNQIAGPAAYSAEKPVAGGPSAGDRLERDVFSLSGVSTIIWFEGINDLSRNANSSVDAITTRMGEIVDRMRKRLPGVRVIGGTVVTALHSTNAAHGSSEQDVARRQLNQFIRSSDIFDAVIDFDAVTVDPTSGELKTEFVPDSTTGGAGDKLHPNRAGYLAMGESIDLSVLGVSPSRR